MLGRLSSVGVAVLLFAGLMTSALPFKAYGEAPCQVVDSNGKCLVSGEVPGVGGGGGGAVSPVQPPGGGDPGTVPECVWKLTDPQPPAGSPVWQGHAPGDGAIYSKWCPNAGGVVNALAGSVWMADAPAGLPVVDPAALAQQLIAQLTLKPPVVRLAPPSGTEGLIGLPVWMWSERSQDVTGPVGDSMTAGAVTVSLWATVTTIVWDMGDGHSVACAGAGTPYTSSAGSSASPDCGHVYELPSRDQPNGVYTVTATATWTIAWQGGGQSGQQTLGLTSEPAELAIRELYVLNSSD